MTGKVVGSLGLVLDIVGVCILFRFGFPQPDLDDSVKIVAREKNPHAPRVLRVWVVMSLMGLLSLVAGFALQLWATWL